MALGCTCRKFLPGPEPHQQLVEIGVAANGFGALERHDEKVGWKDRVLHDRADLIRRVDDDEVIADGALGQHASKHAFIALHSVICRPRSSSPSLEAMKDKCGNWVA